MSAELLRRAAALMRERAEASEPDLAWLTYPQLSGEFNGATSAFIASWHPAVALAVADWLDVEGMWEERGASLTGARVQALTVARTYLGESA